MRHKVLLAVALAALMATPAFAAVQNVKVSGSIDSTYINRQHFGLGQREGAQPWGVEDIGLVDQSVFVTQTTLRVDADLSDNVSTTVGLINERAWGAETTAGHNDTGTEVNLYLAYATMREFLYSPLTVSVGRQYFGYGNGLIIGEDGVNNVAVGPLGTVAADFTKRTTYDGVKATLDYKPLTIDLLYFKNLEGVTTGVANANKDDSDVYGINANYQLGDTYNSVVEGYLFTRFTGDNDAVLNGGASDKGDQLYVPGLRVSTNPIKGLNTQAELAWQFGRKGATNLGVGGPAGGDNIRRDAMAAQFMATYTLPVLEQYKPVASVSYTHVSGDKNAASHRDPGGSAGTHAASEEIYTAWDPFNETQGSGTIYNTLFDLTNMNIFALGLQATPVQDVTASVVWSNLKADRKISTLNPLIFRQPDGTIAGTAFAGATTSSKELGNEYDVNVNYAYTEDVTIGLSLGWFFPGATFDSVNDTVASQALAHVNVNF